MARVLFYERFGSHGTRLPSQPAMRIIERAKGRIPRERALRIANDLVEVMRPYCRKIAVAGSLRRGKVFVGDVDIVAVPLGIGDPIKRLGDAEIVERGETRTVLRWLGLHVDIRLVPVKAWGAALQYLTGSKLHNICLRALAKRKGLLLNEYGLWDGKRRVAGETEGSVYKALGLKWLPPRFREGPFHLPPEG